MSDPYSLLLLLAIAALAAAWVAALLGRRLPPAGRIGRWTAPLAFAALALALASLAVHLATGHRPGTPDAMDAWTFLASHPALAVVAALALAALALRPSQR
jgi:hypothetical protein